MSALVFDPKTNVAILGGQSMVFHCHHYNCALQRAVESSMGSDAAMLLMVPGQEVVREQLGHLTGANDNANQRLAAAVALFSQLGFGRLETGALTPRGGTVACAGSHYAMGWLSKYGERDTPACHFVSGFVAGMVAVAFGVAPERLHVKETRCLATGHSACRFKVEVL